MERMRVTVGALRRQGQAALTVRLILLSSAGITAIINLQEVGEHAQCGYGLQAGGFSYTPERFMQADSKEEEGGGRWEGGGGEIHLRTCQLPFFPPPPPLDRFAQKKVAVYNFGWEDFGVPTMEAILDMVKVLCSGLREGGRVAVHCHAGLGRTGLLIACYLVYQHHLQPRDAIVTVRRKRPGSIQTKKYFFKREKLGGDEKRKMPSLTRSIPSSFQIDREQTGK